ncbi:embryonal Fyn-associated substrate isoform X2 [Desmodus rotundus]|uniref:embryonal Fyn-associated substrate isoform X2 n=1 Tax=Desmodus rotundus TaxID=9430 RepID=UPI001E1C21E3|nr:embryonal Fyn-associated substrate isoform X2 [Desmodus rotundus]
MPRLRRQSREPPTWCWAAAAEVSGTDPGLEQAAREAKAMAIATSALLARALYDNTAESPQELSFRRGDVLRVLQREGAGGLDGWCLCSLHGQQGIVPANRVKLLPEGPAPKPSLSQVPGSPYPAPEYSNEDQEVYVVPPPARPCLTSRSPAGPCLPSPDPIYKVPRGSGTQLAAPGDALEVYDVPPSALRVPSSGPYDSPASFSRPLARVTSQPPGEDEAPYDVPLAPKPPSELEPDLEWEEGREPGSPLYAAPSNLKRASALLNLYEAPEELLTNGEGGATDEDIYDVPLLGPETPSSPEPLRASASSDTDTLALLLARSPPPSHRPRLPSAESLSRRPLPALPVLESPSPSVAPSPAPGRKGSIQDRPLPPPPPRLSGYGGSKVEGDSEGQEVEDDSAEHHNEYEGIRMAEEYDYVHLKEVLSPGEPLVLPAGDLQLLHFYAGQCQSHYSALQTAVAALMSSTRANQPPRLFVPHGKRLVVAAHRLVFVGDTLGRLAASAPLRAQVGAAGTALGQELRATVLAVKGAALGYPSGSAAQKMAQCVTQLAGKALQFTTLLTSLAP